MNNSLVTILTTFGGLAVGYLLSLITLYSSMKREKTQVYNELLSELIEICNMLGDFERYITTDFEQIIKDQLFGILKTKGIAINEEIDLKLKVMIKAMCDDNIHNILIKTNSFSEEKLNSKIDKLTRFDPMMYYQMINPKQKSMLIQRAVNNFSEQKNEIMKKADQDAKDSYLFFGEIGAISVKHLRFELYTFALILTRRCGFGKTRVLRHIRNNIEYYVKNPVDVEQLKYFIEQFA